MEDLLKQYNDSIIDVDQIKDKVEKKLVEYEANLKAAKKPTHEEQDDGWITVHNKGSRDPTKKHSKKRRKLRKTEKLLNFYTFEIKESKLKKHKELLEKFQEDKKRLAKMKEQRKFKLS